jgi:hypothetical protein
MSTTRAQIPAAIGGALKTLLGRPVAVTPIAPPNPPFVGAYFARDDGSVAVLALADFPLVCFTGASLALVPPAVAIDGAKEATPPEGLLENYAEIMNVITGVLHGPNEPHLRYRECIAPPNDVPKSVAAVALRPAARLDLQIAIQGYGAGKLALLFGR